jgi:putative acetyltransferase
MNDKTRIIPVDPLDVVFRAMLKLSDDYAASLYPAESNHMLDVDTLLRPEMNFFGIFLGEHAKGFGGFWTHSDYVEIKRVWIDSSARGLGLSRKLMTHIEGAARKMGFAVARLETGIFQPEALGLYKTIGYVERGPFGDYRFDPLSVFMEKAL